MTFASLGGGSAAVARTELATLLAWDTTKAEFVVPLANLFAAWRVAAQRGEDVPRLRRGDGLKFGPYRRISAPISEGLKSSGLLVYTYRPCSTTGDLNF